MATKSSKSCSVPKPPKLRAACNACHDAKLRCSGERDGCKRCRDLNNSCIYVESKVGKNQGNRSGKRRNQSPLPGHSQRAATISFPFPRCASEPTPNDSPCSSWALPHDGLYYTPNLGANSVRTTDLTPIDTETGFAIHPCGAASSPYEYTPASSYSFNPHLLRHYPFFSQGPSSDPPNTPPMLTSEFGSEQTSISSTTAPYVYAESPHSGSASPNALSVVECGSPTCLPVQQHHPIPQGQQGFASSGVPLGDHSFLSTMKVIEYLDSKINPESPAVTGLGGTVDPITGQMQIPAPPPQQQQQHQPLPLGMDEAMAVNKTAMAEIARIMSLDSAQDDSSCLLPLAVAIHKSVSLLEAALNATLSSSSTCSSSTISPLHQQHGIATNTTTTAAATSPFDHHGHIGSPVAAASCNGAILPPNSHSHSQPHQHQLSMPKLRFGSFDIDHDDQAAWANLVIERELRRCHGPLRMLMALQSAQDRLPPQQSAEKLIARVDALISRVGEGSV